MPAARDCISDLSPPDSVASDGFSATISGRSALATDAPTVCSSSETLPCENSTAEITPSSFSRASSRIRAASESPPGAATAEDVRAAVPLAAAGVDVAAGIRGGVTASGKPGFSGCADIGGTAAGPGEAGGGRDRSRLSSDSNSSREVFERDRSLSSSSLDCRSRPRKASASSSHSVSACLQRRASASAFAFSSAPRAAASRSSSCATATRPSTCPTARASGAGCAG